MLEALLAGAVADASERERARPLTQVEADAHDAPPARDALAALAPRSQVHVIAEIKRASPSRGSLATIANPSELAMQYVSGGASAISVLTEQRQFLGSLEDLRRVRESVPVPVLRKDFIALPYQVFEARAVGADLVLLIVAALEQRRLVELLQLIQDLGMTALVEVHSADEARRAADLGAKLVGVNARDLKTFELDRSLFGRLAHLLPEDAIRVAESAVASPADVAKYRADGAHAVLVGEALVRDGDPAGTVAEFIVAGQ